MGENLARCHRGWHKVRKFLKIWSPRLPEMVFTAPHGGRLYKVVPRPHKTSTCSKLFACCGKCYLYICQLSLHTCTLVIFVRQVCTLAHLRFCLAHPRSRRKLPYSAVWLKKPLSHMTETSLTNKASINNHIAGKNTNTCLSKN